MSANEQLWWVFSDLFGRKDTSRLLFLVEFLREQHFEMIDCQYLNPHLLQFGAYEVSQVVFLEELRRILYQY